MSEENAPLFDRDYSEEFSITLEWREWNRIFGLIRCGLKWKKDPELDIDWSGTNEIEEDKEIFDTFKREFFDSSPGNGMADWPDSMKKAWDETVQEMLEDLN